MLVQLEFEFVGQARKRVVIKLGWYGYCLFLSEQLGILALTVRILMIKRICGQLADDGGILQYKLIIQCKDLILRYFLLSQQSKQAASSPIVTHLDPRTGKLRRSKGYGLGTVPRRSIAPHLFRECRSALLADTANIDTKRRQTLISVIRPKREPEFGTRCEHAIGLADTARGEIIDHHPDIALRPAEMQRLAALRLQCRIETSDQPLRRRLFITRRAVDLPGQEQP